MLMLIYHNGPNPDQPRPKGEKGKSAGILRYVLMDGKDANC